MFLSNSSANRRKTLAVALLATLLIAAVVCVLLSIATFSATAFASETSSASEDWPMYRHDPGHTGYTTVAGPSKPNVLWSFSTSGNPVDSSPAVADGKLYVGSENGNIYCLDAQTGRQIWLNFKIDSATHSPAISNGFLYICDSNNLVYCLDAQTGKINWTFSMGAGGTSPAIANGYVYVSSAGETLYCLDALTGQKVWSFPISSLEPETMPREPRYIVFAGSTSPAVADERVYIGGTNLYCLSADSGDLIWSFPSVIAESPTVSEGKVFFSSWQGDAYCLDAATGGKIWNHSGIGPGWLGRAPAVVDDRVYFGGLIYCLNVSNGDAIWRYSTGDIVAVSGPVVAGQYAYFSCTDSYAYCANAFTGEYVWKSETSFSSSPAVVDGVLYFGSGDSIVAFSDSWNIPMPLLIVVLAFVSICIVFVLAYLANQEGTAPPAKWKKYFTVPMAVTLIVVILVSTVAFICITLPTPSNEETSFPRFPLASSLLWQTDREHFATSMAVVDGKVFITGAGTCAYNAQDGQLLWSTGVGQRGVKVYDGNVYVGTSGSAVYRLNETTGKTMFLQPNIIRYQAPVHTSNGERDSPSFTLGDGKIFVVGSDGLSVYNVDSGGLYWQINDFFWYPHNSPDGVPAVSLGELGTQKTTRLGYVYIRYGARLDANNGQTLWDTGHRSDENLVIDDTVVFWNLWNGSDKPNIIHCVDAAFGQTLWDFDPGSPVYEPVIHDGLLVFGGSDGYLYALDLADGSLAWKTQVDVNGWIEGNNLPAEAKSLSDPSASSIVVDDQTGLGVWGFLLTERQIEGINGDNLYVGVFCSFDLSNGNISRTTIVQNSCTLNDNDVVLAPSQSALFLRAGLDLWIIDRATFNPTQIQHLENPIVPIIGPVSSDGKVYIANNRYLSAYR